MKTRALVSELIVDIDNYSITNIRSHGWDGPLVVDTNDRPLVHTIGICLHPSNVEIVGYGISRNEGDMADRKE